MTLLERVREEFSRHVPALKADQWKVDHIDAKHRIGFAIVVGKLQLGVTIPVSNFGEEPSDERIGRACKAAVDRLAEGLIRKASRNASRTDRPND